MENVFFTKFETIGLTKDEAIKNAAPLNLRVDATQAYKKWAKENVTNEDIAAALKYCHLFVVKLYVTVNTLIFDDEIDSFLEYVRFLHKIGVDAVIMQDIGMITLVRKKFPNLVISLISALFNFLIIFLIFTFLSKL